MTTDRIHSYWPAPDKTPDPDVFKPSRMVMRHGSNWDGLDWVQNENGRTVRYVKPPRIKDWPDLSNCLAIW